MPTNIPHRASLRLPVQTHAQDRVSQDSKWASGETPISHSHAPPQSDSQLRRDTQYRKVPICRQQHEQALDTTASKSPLPRASHLRSHTAAPIHRPQCPWPSELIPSRQRPPLTSICPVTSASICHSSPRHAVSLYVNCAVLIAHPRPAKGRRPGRTARWGPSRPCPPPP